MLALWCGIVQPIHAIQYVFKLLYLNFIAKIIGLLAWPFCILITLLDVVRDTFGGITLPISEAINLRAQYHLRGSQPDVQHNDNLFSKGLAGQCYYDNGDFEMAKKKMKKGFCFFSLLLFLTHSGHRKKVGKYHSTISKLYGMKKYVEVVNFYESNPAMQKYAGIVGTKEYIYALWYSGKTDKALKLMPQNSLYDELRAMDCERKGKLREAAKYYHSAKKKDEETRVLNLIDDKQREVLRNISDCHSKKDYKRVIELFKSNSFINDRKDARETICLYIDAIHATSGVSQDLISTIMKYPNIKNATWDGWHAEYLEKKEDYLAAADHYKAAGMMADYQRMLDKEEERKHIEEEKRIAREKAAAQECEAKGEFLKAAEHYKAAGMMADHQRMLDKEDERKRIEEEKRIAHETEEAKQLEASGQYGAAAKKFKALGLTADYERANKKEHDRRIAQLKEKIKKDYKSETYGEVIKDVESNKELLEDIDIVDCYLWSLWMHDGTEEKAIELVAKYAKQFNTDRWEKLLGNYYKWKKNYEEAIKHYKLANYQKGIDEIKEKQEEERRKKEEEERRKQDEERKRKEKEEAMDKFQECISKALHNMDSDYCDKALEYLKKTDEDDYETRSVVENIKKAIDSLAEEEYGAAKSYFRKAGLPQWADQIDKELEERGYNYYSSERGTGCSECTNACAGSCGRSCSNGCGGSCTSSCGGACSVGRNKRKS